MRLLSLHQQQTWFKQEDVYTFANPIILGKVYDEQPSGLCPRLLKGVWNVACVRQNGKQPNHSINLAEMMWLALAHHSAHCRLSFINHKVKCLNRIQCRAKEFIRFVFHAGDLKPKSETLAHTFCGVDDVEEAEYGDRNSHGWSIYDSDQRLREVYVGFHIPPVISNTTKIDITGLTSELKCKNKSRNVYRRSSPASLAIFSTPPSGILVKLFRSLPLQ